MPSRTKPILERGSGVPNGLGGRAAAIRDQAALRLDSGQRVELGQFFTPSAVASFMAELPKLSEPDISILDPGAGTGILVAAAVARLCGSEVTPNSIEVTAYELDPELVDALRATLEQCRVECAARGIRFSATVFHEDFIEAATRLIVEHGDAAVSRHQLAILNPPYRKLRTDSFHRALLREVGIETSNLYTAFVSLALRLTAQGGELVAITPRSFCNGTYFRHFRHDLLSRFRFRHIHVFERRDEAFREDAVLQENVIFYGVRSTLPEPTVTISGSAGRSITMQTSREVAPTNVVSPHDREAFIHIPVADATQQVSARVAGLSARLRDLGLSISTGRVVDFRATEWLRREPQGGDAPLIYPYHFDNGLVVWPRAHAKKPGAIAVTPKSAAQLIPSGIYVLVRRFSAKEEARRVVAAVFDPSRIPAEMVGIENHLNYFHSGGAGLGIELARGLAAYLNSTAFDTYFRQFSGHTQVNATDLRNAVYPSRAELIALGRAVGVAVAEPWVVDGELDRLLSAHASGHARLGAG